MKKTILITTTLFISSTSFAKYATATDRMMQEKASQLEAIIYQDESTGETCLLKVKEEANILDLQSCSNEQIEKIQDIDSKPKNPEVASAGAAVSALVDLGLAYYTLCSLVQVAPYAVEKAQGASDYRTRTEKFKDVFVPSEDQRKRNALLTTVKEVAADAKATVCKPIAKFNEKIYYFFTEEK